jgi:hypothetical protein
MPANETPNGLMVYVPGVYSRVDVVSDLPGALPPFQVPFVIGSADEGIPYDVASKAYAHEVLPWWRLTGTATKTREVYGPDCDLSTGMVYAKRHGLPAAYTVCLSPLTRATILVTSTGPVSQFTIAARSFGAAGGHIKLSLDTGALTVTPVKRYSFLTEDASSGDTRIYVRDNSWITEGLTVTIGDNAGADADYEVASTGSSLSPTGQIVRWVELTTSLAADCDVAQYGLVCIHDEARMEAPDAFTTGQEMLDWIQGSSKYLEANKHANFTDVVPINVATATAFKDITAWGTRVDGTSPAAGLSDYQAFIAQMDASGWDEFAEAEQVLPQAFLALSADSEVHAELRDWAGAKRSEGYPISVITGCDWGDIVVSATDDTSPVFRARALNSQDIALVAGGMDYLAAFLSTAAAVFGRRLGAGIPHNLTNDSLLYGTLETRWDERGNGELTSLLKAGVITYRLSQSAPYRFVVAQGISTLQANLSSWNVTTKDTCLLMQRDLADDVDRALKEDLSSQQVGADRVTAATVAATVLRRLQLLVKKGKILGFTISSVTLNAGATGYDVAWSVRLPQTIDFINLVTQIQIGD